MPEVTKVSQMQEKNTVAVLETKLRLIESNSSNWLTAQETRKQIKNLEESIKVVVKELRELSKSITSKRVEFDNYILNGPSEQSLQFVECSYETARDMRREIRTFEEQAFEKLGGLKLLNKQLKEREKEFDDFIAYGPKQPDTQQTLPFADDAPVGLIEDTIANIPIPPELQALDLNGKQKEELVKAGCKTLMDVAALANKEWPKYPNGLADIDRFVAVTVERTIAQLPKREPPELKDGESLVKVRLIGFSDVSPLAEPDSIWNAKMLDNGNCVVSFGSVEHEFSNVEFELV